MNFVFEKKYENFINCPDVNPSGIKRFTPSPVATTLIRLHQTQEKFDNLDLSNIKFDNFPYGKKYIIPTGVTHSPYDWTGPDGKGNGVCHIDGDRKNLFSYLNNTFLKDLIEERAFLLLDQSHEGYHYDWLFDWFHNSCEFYSINPKQIIYITGNMAVESQYEQYLLKSPKESRICVIPHAHFEQAVCQTYINNVRFDKVEFASLEEQIIYKRDNLEKVKIYNALQKRPRAHRIWLFKELFFNDLLQDGIVSMNSLDFNNTFYDGKFMTREEYDQIDKVLPILPPGIEKTEEEIRLFADQDSGKYQMRINDDVMMDSWVSVISEASYAEDTCFISEKSFKPIVGYHPFIIFGNKYSLKYLRELGYKTFSPYIDESYDELDSWERLNAIIVSLQKIKNIPINERLNWFLQMKDILIHNFETLRKNTLQYAPTSYLKLQNYFNNVQ